MSNKPVKKGKQPEVALKPVQPQDVVNAELNFLKFPLFVLQQKSKDVRENDQIEYRATKVTEDRTEEIVWKVLPSREYGLPGQFDRQVFRVVEKIISDMDMPIKNPIPLPSLSEFCRMLHIFPNGTNCTLVKEALLRIRSTSIIAKNTVQVREGKRRRYLEAGFGVYDLVVFSGEDLPDNRGKADRNYIFLNQWYLNNLNQFFVRLIDYEYWSRLDNPIAQRLYEILGPQFFGQQGKRVAMPYRELCALGPLTCYPHLSRIRQQLEKAVVKLTETGFLAEVEFAKDRNDEVILYFSPGPRVQLEAERLKEAWLRKRALGPKKQPLLPLLKDKVTSPNRDQVEMEFGLLNDGPALPVEFTMELPDDSPPESAIAQTSLPLEARPRTPERDLMVIVQAFHRTFFGSDKKGRLSVKERQAAQDFIDVLGTLTPAEALDAMEYLKTTHRPWTDQVKHPAGLVHLVPTFLPQLEQRREEMRRREDEARRERLYANLRTKYEDWLKGALEDRMQNLPDQEQHEYDRYVAITLNMNTRKWRKKYKLEDPRQALIRAVADREMADHEAQALLDEAEESAREMILPKVHESLPTFDQWLKQQGLASE